MGSLKRGRLRRRQALKPQPPPALKDGEETMIQIHGVPGTCDARLRTVEWRIGPRAPAGNTYQAIVYDGVLWAIVSRDQAGEGGKFLWHISVSHRDEKGEPDRCPTWDELKHARYKLIGDDVPMVIILPRRSVEYVDDYPTCIHVWESEEVDIDK